MLTGVTPASRPGGRKAFVFSPGRVFLCSRPAYARVAEMVDATGQNLGCNPEGGRIAPNAKQPKGRGVN